MGSSDDLQMCHIADFCSQTVCFSCTGLSACMQGGLMQCATGRCQEPCTTVEACSHAGGPHALLRSDRHATPTSLYSSSSISTSGVTMPLTSR